MKILSFDQASIISGWSLFDDETYVDSGVIIKNKKTPLDKRIIDMAKSICSKIIEQNPDIVVIEDIQNQSSISTTIALARLQGAIIFFCANKNIELKLLHPTEWRKALSYHQGPKVKREELKQQSMDCVKNFGLNIESEDECEAICIGLAARKIYN